MFGALSKLSQRQLPSCDTSEMVAMDSKLNGADPEAPPSERRGSLVVDPTLASEEDAAVLAKMGCVYMAKTTGS